MDDSTDDNYSQISTLFNNINEFFNRKRSQLASDDDKIAVVPADILPLKMAISDVNNVVTCLLTFSFVDWLLARGIINREQHQALIAQVDRQKPNTNGYDVDFHDGGLSIIAEVKGNLPVNNGKYGAAQIKGLEDDVLHLVQGKKKADITEQRLESSLKFLVLLECKDKDAASATGSFLEYYSRNKPGKNNAKLVEVDENEGLPPEPRKDVVYVVRLPLPADIDYKYPLNNQ